MNHTLSRGKVNKKRKERCFRTIMKTKNGCKIIKKRRKKGRQSL